MRPSTAINAAWTAHGRGRAGFTLIEATMASTILALMLGGILAGVMQSRRLTESSINATTAATIVQSYMEQIKSMPVSVMANQNSVGAAQLSASYSLPTQSDQATSDPLWTSTGTPPALISLTPGVTPTGGVVDNLKDVANQNGGNTAGTPTTWPLTWPRALNPSTAPGVPYTGDFHLNLWVWITDLSGTSPNASSVYGITMVYTWQSRDGGRLRYFTNEIRAIRSAVPSF
jgi:Tfp pilus assembly protein PilV